MKPTIEDVKARSLSSGCWCWDCYVAMTALGWPCSKHCTPEEKIEAYRDADAQILRRASHPLLEKR